MQDIPQSRSLTATERLIASTGRESKTCKTESYYQYLWPHALFLSHWIAGKWYISGVLWNFSDLSATLNHSIMRHRIDLFFCTFLICAAAVQAYAISDLFSDYSDFTSEAAVDDPEIFNEVPITSLLDDNVDSNPGLFVSSTQDDCLPSLSADDTSLLSMLQKGRLRPRAELCPNSGSPKLELELPNFGLFNPGGIFDFRNPSDTPEKPPVQIYPQSEGDASMPNLERLFGLPDLNHRTDKINNEEEDPCPYDLVSDLEIPVCDSGNYARDVRRFPGDYFYDLFNIRYCIFFFDCQ